MGWDVVYLHHFVACVYVCQIVPFDKTVKDYWHLPTFPANLEHLNRSSVPYSLSLMPSDGNPGALSFVGCVWFSHSGLSPRHLEPPRFRVDISGRFPRRGLGG